MKKIIIILVCLSFFVNCPGSDEKKKKEKEDQNLLLSLAVISTVGTTCSSANSVIPTSTEQTVPFSLASSFYYSFVPVTVTVGQKVTFTSTTSNIRNIVGSTYYVGNSCTTNSISTNSAAFTRDSGTSTTSVVYTAAVAGTFTFFPSTSSGASQPTDIKVKKE